jgi:hypothetical protein
VAGRHRTAPRFDEQGLGGQGLAARGVDGGFSGPEIGGRTTNTTVDLTEVAQAGVDFYDPVMAELRRAVFDRLRVMNGKHAYNAAELRSERPVGPYAVAFFYRERVPGEFRLRSATRQFLDEGGAEWDLALLLGRLAVIAQVDEPRTQMSDVCDEMRWDAGFFGVGVSSIDDADGRWIDRRDTVTSSLDVGGHCFGLLIDNSMLLFDRHSLRRGGQTRTRVTRLNLDAMTNSYTKQVWTNLVALRDTIVEALRGR